MSLFCAEAGGAKQKIISAGHICIDITPVFPAGQSPGRPEQLLIPGKLIHVEPADVHTGGSVANTGLALKMLGNDVRLMGKVGSDAFGGMVRGILRQYGAADGLLEDPDSSTSYSIVLSIPGVDRIFLHSPGANDTFCGSDIPEDALDGAVLFHFGYPPLMRRMYEDNGAELAAVFRRVRSEGIATSLDMAAIDPVSPAGRQDWKRILERVLPDVDFFVPSAEELCFMLSPGKYADLLKKAGGGDMVCVLDIDADIRPMADTLLGMGCRAVLIKCGVRGMYYRTAGREAVGTVGARLALDPAAWADREGFQRSFKAARVLSATGAGDASIAAYLTAVLRGRSPARCAALAAAEGACAVTAYDALSGLEPLEALEEKIDAGWE